MRKDQEKTAKRSSDSQPREKGDQPMGRLLWSFYDKLHARFGHRSWWPADSPFEVCVGAVLTQNTSWKNVVKAIESLKAACALNPFRLYEMTHDELSSLIKAAGYYNVKARRLRSFIAHLVEKHGGKLDSLFASDMDGLRLELLSIHGIGKETADSIILYAANKPIFVVDAYTRRVLERHSMIDEKLTYDDIQVLFHTNLPRDTTLYNDFHAQFVAVGHHFCKRRPHCEQCPLCDVPQSPA
jgi:endonuclease-3 related protein